MTELGDLITRANNVLSVLEGLIEGDAGKTPLPDPSVSYTLPVIAYNAETSVWTLTQATLDPADGLYKGQFILALDSGCATLTINSHNVTTPGDGVPARVKAPPSEENPTPSFVDVATIAALDGQQFIAFLIRSSTAFEVQVQIAACAPEVNYPELEIVPGYGFGTVEALTAPRWRVTGTTADEGYKAFIRVINGYPGDNTLCFKYANYEAITGVLDYQDYRECDSGDTHSSLPPDTDACAWYLYSDNPFTVEFDGLG